MPSKRNRNEHNRNEHNYSSSRPLINKRLSKRAAQMYNDIVASNEGQGNIVGMEFNEKLKEFVDRRLFTSEQLLDQKKSNEIERATQAAEQAAKQKRYNNGHYAFIRIRAEQEEAERQAEAARPKLPHKDCPNGQHYNGIGCSISGGYKKTRTNKKSNKTKKKFRK
jgi:hypothetical protein